MCGRNKNSYKILIGNSQGEEPLERTLHRWKHNII